MSANRSESEPPRLQEPTPQAAPAEPDAGRGRAVASLVLGILALALAAPVPIAGFVCGLVGLPLGLSSRRRRRERNEMALAGWVMSLVAVVGQLVVFIALSIALAL